MATADSMANTSWKKIFSEKVSTLVGHKIGSSDIYSDTSDYNPYVKQLWSEHPLLLVDSKGYLSAIIPNTDYQKLDSGTLSVEDYLNKCFFYFGYARNTGYLTGVYWQPLQDTEKIYNYLKLLICKATANKNCNSCKLNPNSCPLRKSNPIDAWKKEVNEYDQRLTFFEDLKKHLKNMNFDVAYFSSYTSNNFEVRLNVIGSKTIPYVPQWILNYMLYNPEKENHIINFLKFREI